MSLGRIGTFVLWLTCSAPLPSPLQAQEPCPSRANPMALAGWTALRAGELPRARASFQEALAACPGHLDARTGLGYVDLREGNDDQARIQLRAVLAENPESVDALSGLGILAWRGGDLDEVHRLFSAVERLDPENATAQDYLSRLPRGVGPPPEGPPLRRPDSLVFPARAAGDRLEVRGETGWVPFHVMGVNLGAALPGRFPSEFPDSSTYAQWIRDIAELGANTIRLYTIHPPHFYSALRQHNLENPARPIRLLHGVWTELPPGNDYLDPAWEEGFFQEMRRVVDLIHGQADLPPRPGHASGFYRADVSPWVLGIILGREWEPYSVLEFQALHPEFRDWEGAFVGVAGGNPMDAWLGKAMDATVRYEVETYNHQRPVSYTNWPTLDPLHHPTETTVEEEVAIRAALGEDVGVTPLEYDNDAVGLDAMVLKPTEAYPAGVFATFHAYPYYPDFMVQSRRYAGAASSLGPSDYFGYLQDLKSRHAGIPVVIAEYGVPASIGVAHLQPQGWHHGGHTEREMAAIDRRLTLEIAEAGMAGGAVFAWMDEWFKRNWITLEFEIPEERNRLWLNRLDAEQQYGLVAMDAAPPLQGETFERRLPEWERRPALYGEPDGTRLRAAADAAYLWLQVQLPPGKDVQRVLVGLDLFDPTRGDARWPGRVGGRLPAGLEFALLVDRDEARLLVDPPQNPFRLVPVRTTVSGVELRDWKVADPPYGFFRARAEQRFNLPFQSRANDDGVYDSLRVITNRTRFARDSSEILAAGYDRGVLRPGDAPDGLWSWSEDGTALEVRLPWGLINFTDPSRRRLLQGTSEGEGRASAGSFETVSLGGIGLALGLEDLEGRVVTLPSGGTAADVALFSWPTWEEPDWRARRRPAFWTLRETFRELDAWIAGGASPGPWPWEGTGPAVASPTESPRSGPVLQVPEPALAGGSPSQVEEAADRAWNLGDTERAMTLYQEILAGDPSHQRALHRMALMRAWAGDTEQALDLFRRLLELAPDNLEARVDRARVLAWRGSLDDALAALDRVLDDAPEFPPAVEAQAQFRSWAGQYAEALTSYDRLRDLTGDPTEVRLARARVLSWASRLEESRAAYDSVLALNPGDVAARLGLARVLTLSDDTREAVSVYRDVLEKDPGNLEAAQGLARALTWGGRLPQGEEAWRQALRSNPQDPGVRIGLAQNLRWQGRNAAAVEVLDALSPAQRENPEVREQLGWARASLAPRSGLSVVREDDSDHNVMWTARARAAWNPFSRLSLEGEAYTRSLEQTSASLTRTSWGGTLTATLQIEPGWSFSAGAGGTRTSSPQASDFTSIRLGLASPGRYRAGFGFSLSRFPLDATAQLVDEGVEVEVLDVSVRWEPFAGWQLAGAGGIGVFDGGEENRRLHGSMRLTKRLTGGWSVGAGARAFGFEKNLGDFYFDPGFYGLAEVLGRWLWEPGRWSVFLEAAPGLQRVETDGDPAGAFRTNARLSFRMAPGREIFLAGGYSSTGLQSFSTGDSDYRYLSASFGASWVF